MDTGPEKHALNLYKLEIVPEKSRNVKTFDNDKVWPVSVYMYLSCGSACASPGPLVSCRSWHRSYRYWVWRGHGFSCAHGTPLDSQNLCHRNHR